MNVLFVAKKNLKSPICLAASLVLISAAIAQNMLKNALKNLMNNNQETIAAHAVIGCAQQLLCDMDGVLPMDYSASTTAILWRALEIQLAGVAIESLLLARDGS